MAMFIGFERKNSLNGVSHLLCGSPSSEIQSRESRACMTIFDGGHTVLQLMWISPGMISQKWSRQWRRVWKTSAPPKPHRAQRNVLVSTQCCGTSVVKILGARMEAVRASTKPKETFETILRW
eukprot:Rmarinus@m.10752